VARYVLTEALPAEVLPGAQTLAGWPASGRLLGRHSAFGVMPAIAVGLPAVFTFPARS